MTPAGKTTAAARQAAATRTLACLDLSERFVPQSEHDLEARRMSQAFDLEPVTPGTSAALTFLARVVGAKAAVEVGTGVGVSGLALLQGMTADGVLTSIDAESEHQQAARDIFVAAGIPNRRARLIPGNALTVLPKLSDRGYDLVFVDGDPLETVEYLEQAARLLRQGGLLIVNHAFAGGYLADDDNEDDATLICREVLEAVSSMEEFSPVLLPIGDGLLAAVRV